MDELNNNENLDGNVNPSEPGFNVNEEYSKKFEQQDFSNELEKIYALKRECAKVLIGQSELLDLMLACMLSEGHILLEGVPGIAKTLAAKTVAKTIGADFSRIQFTPDLMPADITGTSVFNMSNTSFSFKKGPIFSNIVLIDEINRAPAKTQSALFEVMEERQISYDGDTYPMDYPFLVIATQNPIEQEGTYRLPEAQLDRFTMKIVMDYPTLDEERMILERYKNHIGKIDLSTVNVVLTKTSLIDLKNKIQEIFIEKQVLDYITSIVHETRNHGRIYLGASPRASLSILKCAKAVAFLSNKNFVTPDDVQYVTPHILNHRIILTPEAEMSGTTAFDVIKEIIKTVEVPR
jgi:MoxR-like ATPase